MNRRTFAKAAALLGVTAASGGWTKTWAYSSPVGLGKNERGPWSVYRMGASYYPEWWDPSEWDADFAGMQRLGMNTVRMGEFAWSSFEPSDGRFTFDWMDRAIEIANRHGIEVLLGTPTAAVPPWLYQQHPDVLGASADGPFTYGGRKGYCTNSPNYLEACARIMEALAQHYGKHPGVIGWQLDNEPGIPFQCLDGNCEHAFQRWLQQRYGSLDELNHVWNGAFWSNHFTDWSQIHFPYRTGEGGWQPAISLDYRRFFSDSYSNHLRRQAQILHANTHNQFIYTNWPSTTWSVDVYKAGADFLDATAWDNYVSAPGLTEYQHQYISSMNHDIARSASRAQRFFCAEQIAYLPPNANPDGLRLQAYLNLAHGSRGHVYFEWRRPVAGGEQYRPSFIKGFDGKLTPQGPALERIGREFAELGPKLADAVTVADVALLYDFTNEFAQGFWSVGTPGDHYDGEASRHYVGLKSLQRNIDVVSLSSDLSGYKIVAAPNLRLVSDADAEKLKQYVANGGVLILNYRAGTQQTDCSMRHILAPGIFTDVAGVASVTKLDLTEYNSAHGQMDSEHETKLGIAFEGNESVYRPRTTMEQIELHGAEAIAHYRGGRMDGLPAVTRNRWKKGWVFYAATDSGEHGFHEALAQAAANAITLRPLLNVPRGVAVTTRTDGLREYMFVLNLTETAQDAIALPNPMENLAHPGELISSLRLGALDAAILVQPATSRDAVIKRVSVEMRVWSRNENPALEKLSPTGSTSLVEAIDDAQGHSSSAKVVSEVLY